MRAAFGLLAFLVSSPAEAGVPAVRHVVQVVFENASYRSALSEGFFKKVADEGALFTNFTAVTHPSQPNYIAMIAGSTLGVLGDGRNDLDARHLGDLLEEKGLDWRVFAEDYPGNCFLGMSSGLYARKHVPFLSFKNVQKDPLRCSKIQGMDGFFTALKSRTLPAYTLVVPNLNHDGHDTGIRGAGRWFSDAFGGVFADREIMKDTLFVITFDESESYFDRNQVYTVLLGAQVRAGAKTDTPADHYSVLRLIEDVFFLGGLGRRDQVADRMEGIWE